MLCARQLHDQKYKHARDAGLPGWGGAERIANLPKVIEERFLSLQTLPKGGRLLEIGCGAGNLSLELAARGYQVTGIDFSEAAIAWARENAFKAGQSVDFRTGNVTDLSEFASGHFEIVFDGNCLHCLIGRERANALREVSRVLKPGGIFLVSSLCSPETVWDFPAEFDVSSRILFEEAVPYRFIPTALLLEAELIDSGFVILKRAIRVDRPFGHANFHLEKR